MTFFGFEEFCRIDLGYVPLGVNDYVAIIQCSPVYQELKALLEEFDCRNLSPSSNKFKNLDGPHIIRVQNQVGPIQGPA